MDRPVVTRSEVSADLVRLGVRRGSAVMLHASMSSIGWVIGGAPTIIDAVLDAVGPDGTVVALTGWEDRPPYHQHTWDPASREAYMRECPAFDPRRSRAEVEHGRVAEAVRTWPGACHSRHPVCAFAAIGGRAAWIVDSQSLDEGYGTDSPLDRLVHLDGAVLLLGAPLDTLTLLHHAEYLTTAEPKRWNEYGMPVTVDGQRCWRTIRELDSSTGALPYERLGLEQDPFAVIAGEALANGLGRRGTVGVAESHLFPAADLLHFAVDWLDRAFAGDHIG